jgi:hypothetical protein
MPALLPNVYRNGELHWNVTVNKMRGLVRDPHDEADAKTMFLLVRMMTMMMFWDQSLGL